MTPSSGTSTFPPFKFRPRREAVNWQQINAVDINLVMSQLDVAVLQDHISTVTFCSLDGERCQQCRSPVDPGLLRLLQLAQLTVEWLLHCQEFLSLNLHASEERLGAASKQLLEQQSKQEQKVKALKGELELKGKAVHDLQSKLLLSSHKVQLTQRYWSPLAFHTCISITPAPPLTPPPQGPPLLHCSQDLFTALCISGQGSKRKGETDEGFYQSLTKR